MPPSTSAPAPTHPGSLLALAVSAGIVTGFGELAKVGLDLFQSDFTHRSRDALWMIPAFDAALFALVGLVLLMIGRWVRVSWPVVSGCAGGPDGAVARRKGALRRDETF